MAEHNMAIEVDPPDRGSLHDFDVEAGIGTSRCHLIENFEEEPPRSVSASIQKSIHNTVRKARYYTSFITKPLYWLLNKFQLLIVIALYSVFGAWLFTTLEVPSDLAKKQEAFYARHIARDVMILNLRAIHHDNKEDREERWKDAVMRFEEDLGLSEPSIETAWTFWMAFLYAGTIYTTIGYGNIACQTRGGQIATLAYAFAGIPIMIIILNDLGDFLLRWVKWFANNTSDLLLYFGVRYGVITLEEGSKRRLRFVAFSRRLSKAGIISATSIGTLASQNATLDDHDPDDEEKPKPDPPVFTALVATFGWIFLSAGVFCIWEDWDYFTSIYFFFISCSTIGLGDVVPAHPEYMIFAFGVVMVGLSLVTVCINVVQEKLEMMYKALLDKLMEDYLTAVKNGDPNAAAGMMKGFQGRAKFLMPLISKNQGAKVMNQFKDECVAKGIDPPAVLTDIDPSTGMPAFASANKEEFKDYIDHAEEKRSDERKLEDDRLLARSTPQSLTPQTRRAQPPLPALQTFGTQTITPQFIVEKHSFCAQFSPDCSDEECQTTDSESTDEGIQTWPSCEDIYCQYDAVTFKESYCQYDLVEEPKRPPISNTSVQITAVMCTTGIQPEVSSIYFADDDVTASEMSEDSQSEDEEEEEAEPESTNQRRDEEESEQNLDLLTIPELSRLRKSVSEESQDTIIHVSPSESPTSRRKPISERKKEQKEKRAKERAERREARHQARGLRFMKSSGDQTDLKELFEFAAQTEYQLQDSATQHIITMAETSTQYFKDTKGRRCQTKLTCITPDHLLTVAKPPPERRRPRRRPFSNQQSVRSSVASSEPAESTSSYDQLPMRPSLASIDESFAEYSYSKDEADETSDPSYSNSDEHISVEEVCLNLNLVSRPVDEQGVIVVEMFDDEDDDVFGSDVDLSQEDLELFAISCETQTEEPLKLVVETQASASMLDLLSSAQCQTELSTMRIEKKSKKPRERRKTSKQRPDTEEILQETANALSAEKYSDPLGVENTDLTSDNLKQSVSAAENSKETEAGEEKEESVSVEKGAEPDDVSSEEDDVRFMKETGVQTMNTSFYAPAVQSSLSTSDSRQQSEDLSGTASPEPTNLHFLVDQPAQTMMDTENGETQTLIVYKEQKRTQTEEKEYAELEMQTAEKELAELETQTTTRELMEGECQTLIESRELEMQTDEKEFEVVETQTVDRQLAELEMQTDEREFSTTETQTPKESTNSAVQMEKHKEDTVAQTEYATTDTGVQSAVWEQSSSSVDATTPVISSHAQSDVSMFVVDQKDRSKMEVAHDVRFNVDSCTWMEEKRMKEMACQGELRPESEAVAIQCSPHLTTSHTQHHFACLSDQAAQTDIFMKHKHSQEVDATRSEQDAGSDAFFGDFEEAGVQATKETEATGTDVHEYEETVGRTHVLWSDFDRVIPGEEGEEEEMDEDKGQDVETQTEEMREQRIAQEDGQTQTTMEDREVEESLRDEGITDGSDVTEKYTQGTAANEKGEKNEEHIQSSVMKDEGDLTGVTTLDDLNRTTSLDDSSTREDVDESTESDDVKRLNLDELDIAEVKPINEQDIAQKGIETKKTKKRKPTVKEGENPQEMTEGKGAQGSEEAQTAEKLKELEDEEEKKIVWTREEQSQTTIDKEDGETQTVIDKEEAGTQAVTSTSDAGSGLEMSDDWVKVYVAELDLERRLKMLDIGIQTGVLARVQHMYGRKEPGASESEQGTSEMPRVNVRKTVSTEQLPGMQHKYDGSEESLARTGSVMSIAESLQSGSPATSKQPSRSSSFKKPRRQREREMDAISIKDQKVSDLRSRFEQKGQPREGRTRSSSAER